MKYYLVTNKSDDYGNCRTEVVHTTLENANQYYFSKEVDETDLPIIKKYLDIVSFEEENLRTSNERFY
jgi:hypothetical protein